MINWINPSRADELTRALRLAEDTCLNTALIGLVIGHESSGFVNELYWGDFGPSAKTNAGWPRGSWLPPPVISATAAEVLRTRTSNAADKNRTVEWAQWQLGNWWGMAAIFEAGAVVEAIDDAGTVLTATPVSGGRASSSPVGEIFYCENDQQESQVEMCAIRWPLHVASDRVRTVQERRCIFPRVPNSSLCRLHAAAGLSPP